MPNEEQPNTQQNASSNNPDIPAEQDENSVYLWDEKGDKIEDENPDTIPPVTTDNEQNTDADTKEADKKLRADSFKLASEFGSIGLFLLIAVVISYHIGKWCDQFLGTKPILTVFWICCGIAATVLEAIKNIKKASKLDQSNREKP